MLRLMRLITVITLALAASVILYATERPAEASETLSTSTDDGLSLTLSEDGQVVGLALTDTHLTHNIATYQPGVDNAANKDEATAGIPAPTN